MKLKFEQPLPHRPGVLVHRGPDGKCKVIGDGNPFTSAEHAALSPVIEPARHELPFTAEERAELAEAEARLAEAVRLRERAELRMFDAQDRCRTYERNLGVKPSEQAVKRAMALRVAHDDVRKTWEEARDAEGLARREQTAVSRRVHHATRMRKLAAEHAETPPPNTPPTLAERMAGLSGRLAGARTA